jgi:hypothetical protein
MGKGRRVKQQRRALQMGLIGAGRETGLESLTAPEHPGPPATEWPLNWRPERTPHPCTALASLADQRSEVRRRLKAVEFAIAQEVARERATGASWVEVGAALGITRQGARQKFGDMES